MVRASVVSRVDRCLGSSIYEVEVSGAGFSHTVFRKVYDLKAINQCPSEELKPIPWCRRSKALLDGQGEAFAKALSANLATDPAVSDRGLQHFLQLDGVEAEADAFLLRVKVVPWGVLGLQLQQGGDARQAPAPDGSMVIVDPAGLPFIQRLGPGEAGGASAAIYKFLGISAFPQQVVSGISSELEARLFQYGRQPVIHAVGRDFRQADALTPEEAMESLTVCYRNVLREFAASGVQRLRLLPMSGGIYSGELGDSIAFMTFLALARGFMLLEPEQRAKIAPPSSDAAASHWVELCIYDPADLPEYQEARQDVLSGDFTSVPGLASLPRVRTLYHGTSWASAEQIKSQGMRASKSGCLGRGAYLADKDKAARFAACTRRHGGEPALVTLQVSFNSMRVVRKDDTRWQRAHDLCYATGTSLSTNPEWCAKDPARLQVIRIEHLDKKLQVEAVAQQKKSAEAARAGGKQYDYEVDKFNDLKSQFGGSCMRLHHGPGAAGTCRWSHGWHFWCCHYCQTVQYWGACVNGCDWGTFGWTCIAPKCKGKDCGCRKGRDYWREHGRIGAAIGAKRKRGILAW